MSAAAEYRNQIILFVNFIWFYVFYDILEISHEMYANETDIVQTTVTEHRITLGWHSSLDQTQFSPIWLENIKIY